jgi:2-phospho-L-lactate guanylyltransferase
MPGDTFVLLPIKRPEDAKTRLSPWLSGDERRDLVFYMAMDVLDALEGLPTVVISPSDIRPFLRGYDFHFLRHDPPGLESAVEAATAYATGEGAAAVIFMPADLPLVKKETIEEVVALGEKHRVIMSPSRRMGIGMLYRRPPDILRARFSSNSFIDNLVEARGRGVDVFIYHRPELYIDLDTPEDVKMFLERGNGTRSHEFLRKLSSRFR